MRGCPNNTMRNSSEPTTNTRISATHDNVVVTVAVEADQRPQLATVSGRHATVCVNVAATAKSECCTHHQYRTETVSTRGNVGLARGAAPLHSNRMRPMAEGCAPTHAANLTDPSPWRRFTTTCPQALAWLREEQPTHTRVGAHRGDARGNHRRTRQGAGVCIQLRRIVHIIHLHLKNARGLGHMPHCCI